MDTMHRHVVRRNVVLGTKSLSAGLLGVLGAVRTETLMVYAGNPLFRHRHRKRSCVFQDKEPLRATATTAPELRPLLYRGHKLAKVDMGNRGKGPKGKSSKKGKGAKGKKGGGGASKWGDERTAQEDEGQPTKKRRRLTQVGTAAVCIFRGSCFLFGAWIE